MNPRKVIRRWLRSLATAPDGAQFEVGLMWHPIKRWRVCRARLEWARANDDGSRLSNDRAAMIGKSYLGQG